jgi:transcriptional regulator with XRE-family HTH domain
MARAALGLTLKDLADRAGVNMNTISRYEAGAEILTGTMQRIEDVLRQEGVVFIDEDENFHAAIRIRKEPVPFVVDIQSPDDPRYRFKIPKTKPKSPNKRKG